MSFLNILIFVLSASCFWKVKSDNNVKLIFIEGDSLQNLKPHNIPWNNIISLINSNIFDKIKDTVTISHGWKTNFSSPVIENIVDSFLTRKSEYNILVLDWSSSADKNYLAAVSSIPMIAEFIASNIIKIDAYYSVEKFYFVGHSLGSHLLGHIGRRILEIADIKVKRITGLDPAGPLFFPDFPMNPVKALQATDAKFVDVIHTNSRQAGSVKSIGHVDFWPNNGRNQPGCEKFTIFNIFNYIQDDCNHNRAWMYYAESVRYNAESRKFRSVKCRNYQLFSQNSCTGAPVFNFMGYHANSEERGNFYLTTNDKPPYSK